MRMTGEYMRELQRLRQERRERDEEARRDFVDTLIEESQMECALYRVVEARNHAGIQAKVEAYLQFGWELAGGLVYYKDGYGDHYVQSVHKPLGHKIEIKEETHNYFEGIDFDV